MRGGGLGDRDGGWGVVGVEQGVVGGGGRGVVGGEGEGVVRGRRGEGGGELGAHGKRVLRVVLAPGVGERVGSGSRGGGKIGRIEGVRGGGGGGRVEVVVHVRGVGVSGRGWGLVSPVVRRGVWRGGEVLRGCVELRGDVHGRERKHRAVRRDVRRRRLSRVRACACMVRVGPSEGVER